jgi:CRP-like cAMP-binding protein
MDEFFGEMALLTGKPRTNGARAATHANLWVLYRSDFDDLVNRYPAISMALSQVLTERLTHLDRRFTESHLRGLKLLAGLTPGQLEDVSRRLKPVRYRQGEVIIREGQAGHEMYLMESGRVRVVRGQGQDAVVLDEMGAGDLFGEMALLTGKPRSATVVALTDLNLWMIAQSDFDELVTAYPNLALALSRLLSERLRDTDDRILTKPAPETAAPPARRPAPAPRPVTARPAPRRRPRPAPARRRRRGPSFLDGIITWFGELSPGAKVRLLLITMALAWIVLIAAPVLVISTLAADNVTNLQGAIAFVQTATPPPTEALSIPAEEVAPAAPIEDQPVQAQMLAAEPQAPQGQEAVEAQTDSETGDAAASQVETQPLPTETPWIIVITNTPPPPTNTPQPTPTPLPPTATPRPSQDTAAAPPPTPTPTATAVERPQPQRQLDPRLDALNIRVDPAGVRPGQSYWRLVEARWANESEAGGGHSIFVDVVDEGGNRLVGQSVEIRWESGNLTVTTEDKPINEYAANFPMYNTLGSYVVSVAGLPSDLVAGLGLGSIEQPDFKVHTCFYLTFQRTTR